MLELDDRRTRQPSSSPGKSRASSAAARSSRPTG